MAPDFTVRDIYGRRVALADYAGSKLLVSFHRAAVCPLCNIRTWHLIDRYPAYQRRGFNIIIFFESSPAASHHYLDRLRAPFPIIADLERSVYALYGLESSLLGALYARLFRGSAYREAAHRKLGGNVIQNVTQMDGKLGRLPAEFLIGPDQRINTAFYARDAGDFMLFSQIDRFVAAP